MNFHETKMSIKPFTKNFFKSATVLIASIIVSVFTMYFCGALMSTKSTNSNFGMKNRNNDYYNEYYNNYDYNYYNEYNYEDEYQHNSIVWTFMFFGVFVGVVNWAVYIFCDRLYFPMPSNVEVHVYQRQSSYNQYNQYNQMNNMNQYNQMNGINNQKRDEKIMSKVFGMRVCKQFMIVFVCYLILFVVSVGFNLIGLFVDRGFGRISSENQIVGLEFGRRWFGYLCVILIQAFNSRLCFNLLDMQLVYENPW